MTQTSGARTTFQDLWEPPELDALTDQPLEEAKRAIRDVLDELLSRSSPVELRGGDATEPGTHRPGDKLTEVFDGAEQKLILVAKGEIELVRRAVGRPSPTVARVGAGTVLNAGSIGSSLARYGFRLPQAPSPARVSCRFVANSTVYTIDVRELLDRLRERSQPALRAMCQRLLSLHAVDLHLEQLVTALRTVLPLQRLSLARLMRLLRSARYFGDQETPRRCRNPDVKGDNRWAGLFIPTAGVLRLHQAKGKEDEPPQQLGEVFGQILPWRAFNTLDAGEMLDLAPAPKQKVSFFLVPSHTFAGLLTASEAFRRRALLTTVPTSESWKWARVYDETSVELVMFTSSAEALLTTDAPALADELANELRALGDRVLRLEINGADDPKSPHPKWAAEDGKVDRLSVEYLATPQVEPEDRVDWARAHLHYWLLDLIRDYDYVIATVGHTKTERDAEARDVRDAFLQGLMGSADTRIDLGSTRNEDPFDQSKTGATRPANPGPAPASRSETATSSPAGIDPAGAAWLNGIPTVRMPFNKNAIAKLLAPHRRYGPETCAYPEAAQPLAAHGEVAPCVYLPAEPEVLAVYLAPAGQSGGAPGDGQGPAVSAPLRWSRVRRLANGGYERRDVERLARALSGRLVGVALGGGGALGLANVALLQELARNRIPVDIVSGNSFGAVVGAYYASEEVDPESRTHRWLSRFAAGGRGLAIQMAALKAIFRAGPVAALVNRDLENRRVRETPIRFLPFSVNAESLEPVIIEDATLGEAVAASGAAPAVFAPVTIGETRFLDGAVVANVPAEFLLQAGCGLVISMDPIPRTPYRERPGRTPGALQESAVKRTSRFDPLQLVRRLLDGLRASERALSIMSESSSSPADISLKIPSGSVLRMPVFIDTDGIVANAREVLLAQDVLPTIEAFYRGIAGRPGCRHDGEDQDLKEMANERMKKKKDELKTLYKKLTPDQKATIADTPWARPARPQSAGPAQPSYGVWNPM